MPSVSEPATPQEAAQVLRHARAEGLRVSIARDGGDVVFSTRGLSRVLEHEAGDLTCTVEAGIGLSELNELLAEHGEQFALDPPGDPTVGACIAGNLSGPRRHRYGTARDLVLGVTVVLADGTVASSGGKVVKNVAGYDLGKLVCGSHGKLGLIARASLRLHPLSETRRTLVAPLADPADAHARVQAILRSQLVPTAVDVLWPGRLALLFEGSERAVAQQRARAQELVGGDEDETVWAEVAARQAAGPARVSFAPGELATFLAQTPDAVVRASAGVAYVPEPRETSWSPLAERIRRELDPTGVFV